VWQLARELREKVYQIALNLPSDEKYNLSIQLKRAAVSVTANIAEGYGRYHYQENIQFCRQSRGSLYEIQDHLITCKDQNYISQSTLEELHELCTNTIRTLNGYIRYLQKQKNSEKNLK